MYFWELIGDFFPENSAYSRDGVELFQVIFIGGRSQPRDDKRYRYGDKNDDVDRIGERDVGKERQVCIDGKRCHHRYNFRPCVQPPPEPAEYQNESRSRTALDDEFPRSGDGLEDKEGDVKSKKGDQKCQDARDDNKMGRGSLRADETFIEVIDKIARSPVQMGRERRHVSGKKCGDEQSFQAGRQQGLHHMNEPVLFLVCRQVGEQDDAG